MGNAMPNDRIGNARALEAYELFQQHLLGAFTPITLLGKIRVHILESAGIRVRLEYMRDLLTLSEEAAELAIDVIRAPGFQYVVDLDLAARLLSPRS